MKGKCGLPPPNVDDFNHVLTSPHVDSATAHRVMTPDPMH